MLREDEGEAGKITVVRLRRNSRDCLVPSIGRGEKLTEERIGGAGFWGFR